MAIAALAPIALAQAQIAAEEEKLVPEPYGYWYSAGGSIYNIPGTKVGIGLSNPWAPLSVNGNLETISESDNPGGAGIFLSTSTGTSYNNLRQTTGGKDFAIDQFNGSWQNRLLVKRSNGYVGINNLSPAYRLDVNGDIRANGGWVRINGSRGVFFQSYGGGIHMSDNTWIRTYGNKSFYHNTGIMRTDGTLQVGPSGSRFQVDTQGDVSIPGLAPTSGSKMVVVNADGKLAAQTIPGGGGSGDNLGNHSATTNLDMNAKQIREAAIEIGMPANTYTSTPNGTLSAKFTSIGTNAGAPTLVHPAGRIYGDYAGNGGWHGQQLVLEASNNWNSYSMNQLVLKGDGNVGIGKQNPAYKLDVNGIINASQIYVNGTPLNGGGTATFNYIDIVSNGDAKMQFSNGQTNGLISYDVNDGGGFMFRTQGTSTEDTKVFFRNDGFVGIGTRFPSHMLTVNGTVKSEGIIVDNVTNTPDYVFEDSYPLMPLHEVEGYIEQNGHLPGVPSAQEVATEGLDVVSMELKLLEKVEELTLHILELNKRIAQLETENKQNDE